MNTCWLHQKHKSLKSEKNVSEYFAAQQCGESGKADN